MEKSPLGERVSIDREHLSIRYSGEVVRVETWSPRWGRPREGEVYVRVLVLQQRRGGLRPVIQDPRIAVCLSAPGLYRRRSGLSGEISTTRETQAIYLTQRDTEADLIRQTLQRRVETLGKQVLAEDSLQYFEGQVLTESADAPDPASVFAGMDPNAWFSRLAGRPLEGAYPTLPLPQRLAPGPVDGDACSGLYRDIFEQSDASSGALEHMGLGLSDSAIPGILDPAGCPALDLLRTRASSGGEPDQWAELHCFLAHGAGLTGPLATLCLLIWVYSERPELAVDLLPIHQLTLADGRPLLSNRITPDLIPALAWDERVASWAQTIGPLGESEWDDARQHFSALYPGLATVSQGDDVQLRELALLESMESLALQLTQARELLALLEQVQQQLDQRGREDDSAGEMAKIGEALTRLPGISGQGFQSIFRSIRDTCPDYRQLEIDVALLRQMAELGNSSEEIIKAQEYLEGAAVPSGRYPALSVERQALQAALSPASLVASRGRNWSALVQDMSCFKSRFAAAYLAHHTSVHLGLPPYIKDLESARLKLAALELLNTLPELGEPAGAGLEQDLPELYPGTSACRVLGKDLQLDNATSCGSCRLTLEQSLPTEELARVLAAIDLDLAAKSRRLSNLLVEQIMQGCRDQRLDDFLSIVQASDLSALCNTLTPEMVAFIRAMLG